MGERIMKNFPIEYEGNTYWRSRSCTAVAFVFCVDKEDYVCILANQRGPGTPTNVGKWNTPCGYIGFIEECGDVDGNHAAARETYEETGVKIDPKQFHFDGVTFSKSLDQNINLRYWVKLPGTIDDYPLSNAANEEGETSDIKWIRVKDIENYEWAFGHEKAIPEMCNKHVDFFVDENNRQTNVKYLVNLETIIEGDDSFKSNETLAVCDSVEKCKEFTDNHIQMMQNTNSKHGITWEPYNITDVDAIIKCIDKDKRWYYWYTFIPVEHYE